MSVKQKLCRLSVVLLACALFAGSASAATIATITVTAPSKTVKIGSHETLKVVAKDSLGHVITGVTYTWKSSNLKVMTVSKAVVKAIGAGSAKITATAGGKSGSVTITVPKPTALTGVAAKGAPLASYTITLVDKKGTTLTTTTGIDGSYTLNTTGLTPPFLVKAQLLDNPPLYSVSADAEAASVVNVDPLTDLIIRSWYSVQGKNMDTAFANPVANPPPSVTEVQLISNVVVQVTALWLQQAGVDTTQFNPINTLFAADGTGVDAVLDLTTIDTGTGTITITSADTLTVQASTVNYDGGAVTVDTSTTGPAGDSSSETGTVVATTTAMQSALTGITTALTNFTHTVNTKGDALANTDLTAFIDARLINEGLTKSQFAASTADQFRGHSLAFQILNIASLDTGTGIADVLFTATVDSTQTQTAEFFFKKQSDGTWRFYGDQLPTKLGVQSEMRTNQGFINTDSGPDINVDIRPLQGAYTGISIDDSGVGVFANVALNKQGTEVDVYTPNPATPGTTVEIDRDEFFANSGVLASLVPAGTPITITMTPTTGSPQQFTVKTNAFTTESISITNLTGTSLTTDGKLGTPLHVVWTLPTTFAIAEVKIGTELFDGDQTQNTTNSCNVDGPILGVTDTSTDITIPTTVCGGGTTVQANINLEVTGVNGERETVIYSYSDL